MFRIFFITVHICFFVANIFAQCTPDAGVSDPEGNGELVPDTLHAWENVTMNTTLTIIAPDTVSVAPYGSLTLHHITIKNLNNKPAWLSYACNPSDCGFNSGVLNCALVSGTPPAGSANTYPLDVIVDVYMDYGGNPVLIASNYNSGMPLILIVHPAQGIMESKNQSFSLINIYPNPFNSITNIGFYTSTPCNADLKIFDIAGREVVNESINATPGENFFKYNASELGSGCYIYKISNGNNNLTSRLFKIE